jgi:hypothetical protein
MFSRNVLCYFLSLLMVYIYYGYKYLGIVADLIMLHIIVYFAELIKLRIGLYCCRAYVTYRSLLLQSLCYV